MTNDLKRQNEITSMRNEFVDLAAGIGSAVVACVDPVSGLITAPLFATGLKSMFGASCSANMEDVLRRQGERLEALEQAQQQAVLLRLQSPKGQEFQYQVCWHGLNSFTDERRERIAQLATKGLSGTDDELAKAAHFLRIQSQLGDEDIAVLVEQDFFDNNFPTMHPDDKIERNRSVNQDGIIRSRRQFLSALGLMKMEAKWDDSSQPAKLSVIGQEFLQYIDLNDREII